MRFSVGLFVFCAVAVALQTEGGSAATCSAAVQKGLPELGADTHLDIGASDSVAAGKPFTVSWRRGPFPDRYPAYLMIAFDGPVRLEGEGLYALLPGAEAAFGIARFADRTRAVIPYYGRGVPLDGKFAVVPLQAGTLVVEWAVVGHDGCKEIVADGGRGSVTISVGATGAPEIVVNDFAAEEPRERIYSLAGGRVIEVYDGRYRLVDEVSRAEIAERAGENPRFSPTGRYVAAYAEDGIEIIDTVDGKTVYREPLMIYNGDLAWENGDSFTVLGHSAWGAIDVVAPSFKNPVLVRSPDGGFACHACSATDSTAVRIDLENNVVAFSSGHDDRTGYAVSLTVGAQSEGSAIAFVKRQSQVVPFALPKRWEFRGGLKFSHLNWERVRHQHPEYENASQEALLKFLVRPTTEPPARSVAARGTSVSVAQWRGLTIAGEADADLSVVTRLGDVGLPVPAGRLSEADDVFSRDVVSLGDTPDDQGLKRPDIAANMKATARRIEQEVPSARGAFTEEAWECVVQDENKIREKFQMAFRFENSGRVIWITHEQCHAGSGAFLYPSLALFDTNSSSIWTVDQDTGNVGSNVGNACYANIASCDLDAQIFGDRLLVLSSADSRAIEIFDLETHKNLFNKYDLPRGDLLRQVLVSPDGRLVLQINSDGSFAGFRLDDAAELFEGRYVDDEVVVWTPDGRFDATSEGAHYVNLRLPGRVGTYTFEQFSARLKTPGLVQKLIAGETFPAVSLVSPPSLSGAFEANGGRVLGTAEVAADTPVASLLVFQDGLMTDKLDQNVGADWDFDVGLLPGTRWVSLVAVDKAGLASLPMGRDLPPASGAERRLHLLAVGVDNYDDPAISDLQYGRSDALRFAEAASAIGGDVVVASSRVLEDKDATREGVLAALRQTLSAAGTGDTVVLLFAGHGVTDADGAYFLATSDTRIDDIAGSALPWEEVAALLREKKARIAVFLDTCHSGAAGTGTFSTNDGAATSLLERIPSGIVVFSASKGRELSEEALAFGGGVFTSALVDVIAGNRARFDANRNGAIEISELYRGVKAAVKAGTEGRQTPWIARNQMVGDFALF